MDTLRLIRTFIKVNVEMSLAYRSEAVIEFLLDLMWLGWELLSLQIIFWKYPIFGRMEQRRFDRIDGRASDGQHIHVGADLAQHGIFQRCNA